MLHLKQDDLNTCDVTVSNESELTNPKYLWCLTNLQTQVKTYFIPYNATVANATRFDTFTFSTNQNDPIILSGSLCNLHLEQGQYTYTIYDQVSTSNINPALANAVVETGIALMPNTEVCFNLYEDEKKNPEMVIYEEPTTFYTYQTNNEDSVMVVYYNPTCLEYLKWEQAFVNWEDANFDWEDKAPILN